jgi:ATP-dependent Clp protease ATP-binding subunit ClpA
MAQLRHLMSARTPGAFVGRERELEELCELLGPRGSVVVHLVGVPGIGKTTLLDAFCARQQAAGATVVRLDCRAIEPTDRGLLDALGQAAGCSASTVSDISARLGEIGNLVLLALDNYEMLRPANN